LGLTDAQIQQRIAADPDVQLYKALITSTNIGIGAINWTVKSLLP